ncbi:unnamed protein product [Acidithrix sp. C25]|nr:unnamed protein product [Acidithrix sp. C25]
MASNSSTRDRLVFLVGKEVGAFKLWNYLGNDQKIYPVGAVG